MSKLLRVGLYRWRRMMTSWSDGEGSRWCQHPRFTSLTRWCHTSYREVCGSTIWTLFSLLLEQMTNANVTAEQHRKYS